MNRTTIGFALVLASAASGCATTVKGARALQPSQAVDTPDAWIYLQTDDPRRDGVYRCYDNGHKPVCAKAMIDYDR